MLIFKFSAWPDWHRSIESDGERLVCGNRSWSPTDEGWEKFWKEIDGLGVWDWEDKYSNFCMDGANWTLVIKHNGKGSSSEGSNAYPGVKGTKYGKTFKGFLDAMDRLVGEELSLIPPPRIKPALKDQSMSLVFSSFTPTFRYRVENGEPIKQKVLNEDLWEADGVVYARTHKKKIVYIGKTDGKLKARIKDHLRRILSYKEPKDIDYRDWAEGKTVTIYAYKPKNVKCLGLPIQIHVGLERALIDAINPIYVSRR